MREIKFRYWNGQQMYLNVGYHPHEAHNRGLEPESGYTEGEEGVLTCAPFLSGSLMQYTGKKCHNSREVYEGDILFYEEEEDDRDVRYYLVVTWISEWAMFATLHLEEYKKYLSGGAKELDEVLYWTYPIEEVEDYHYAGDIYQHQELLEN